MLDAAVPGAVFTSSETLLDFHRDRIVQATRAPVADRYGNAELSVSAVQCPNGRYHVDTEFCVLEIEPHDEGPDLVRAEVIATGGLAPLFAECSAILCHSDPDLTLKGLYAVHRRNQAQ